MAVIIWAMCLNHGDIDFFIVKLNEIYVESRPSKKTEKKYRFWAKYITVRTDGYVISDLSYLMALHHQKG